jgi:hypothetical protein
MERGSDKLNPRVDAELGQETEGLQRGAPVDSRAEEYRSQEEGGDDQPAPDTRPEVETEIEARSELARFLEPSAFPADREALLAAAREQQAPDPVLALLSGLPEGQTFANVEQVWEALGGEPPDATRF